METWVVFFFRLKSCVIPVLSLAEWESQALSLHCFACDCRLPLSICGMICVQEARWRYIQYHLSCTMVRALCKDLPRNIHVILSIITQLFSGNLLEEDL